MKVPEAVKVENAWLVSGSEELRTATGEEATAIKRYLKLFRFRK